MNYFEEALESTLYVDRLFHEELLEQMYVEQDFMLSCLENNIILEAEAPAADNKGSWLTKIKEFLKNLFDKFVKMVQELFNNDEKWIKENLPKLGSLNFDGLTVTTYQYWNMEPNTITGTLDKLQGEISKYKPNDRRLSSLQERDAVENNGEFKRVKGRKNTFADGVKIYFKTGDGNEPQKITLTGNNLKTICQNEMSKYVVAYNNTILPSFKRSYNNFNKELNNVEKLLKTATNVNESFCLLENEFYSDTDLRFCMNYSAIFEAEGDNNTDKKEPVNKVQDTTKDNPQTNTDTSTGQNAKVSNSEPNKLYYTYAKHAIQLNQLALAAAMTACEERYRAYMSILRGVIGARAKTEKTTNVAKPEENKK